MNPKHHHFLFQLECCVNEETGNNKQIDIVTDKNNLVNFNELPIHTVQICSQAVLGDSATDDSDKMLSYWTRSMEHYYIFYRLSGINHLKLT